MRSLDEMRNRFAALVTKQREILKTAEDEGRDSLNTEEQSQYDKIGEDRDALQREIDREADLQAIEERLKKPQEARTKPKEPEGQQAETRDVPFNARPEYRDAYNMWLTRGMADMALDERRALQVDQANIGGFWLMPEQMVDQMLKFVDDGVTIRRLATVFQVPNADSLGIPSFDTDVDDADWTVELGTGSEDSAARVGKRSLTPHPFAKRIKASETWLRKVSPDKGESFVRSRLAYKIGLTENKAFLTGSGSQRPLGVFTASADGISTGRDVSTGNTGTSIQFDGLKEAEWTLKQQYWANAQWLFHRDAMKQIDKLKDGEGRYILQPNMQAGPAMMLLGRPFNLDENAPNTFTSGLYVGIFADFSFYYVADALNMRIQRLAELYAETNQVGFISRQEVDGMPVLEEAFVRVKLG